MMPALGAAGPSSTMGKLWSLLSPAERRVSLVLLGLMLIGMVLEMLGIGLVIPALAFMTHTEVITRYPLVAPWLRRLGNPTREQLVVAGMLTLVVIHTIRVSFLAFLAWRQARFTFGLQADFSQRVFTGYLRQPYTFHLQRNSAQLIRNAMSQVGDIMNVVQQGLTMATEGLVLLGTTILLMVVEPVGAVLVVTTFGLASWAFSRVTRARLARWGEARQVHEGLRIQHLQQGLGGAKDVKLLGREDDFLLQYRKHNTGSAKIGQWQSTLQALPRLWLELLAIVELAVLVLVMVARGRALDALLPTLGLFAAAAFRLMPSVSRILGAVQTVRFSVPVIDAFYAELALLEMAEPPKRGALLPFNESLSLEGVGFRYPAAAGWALSDVTLSIPRGSSVGFIGSSGAGKSTLVDIILGLLSPETGTVRVDGIDIRANLRGWQDQIGYVAQSIYLTDDTLRRNVAFGLPSDKIDEAAVLRALRAAQLEDFVNELPQGLDTVVGERGIRLSGGQRQRIGIARALYHDPPVLVLDEATSSVDIMTERGVMESVRALHGAKTILIVAHRASTVEHCDRLFRIDRGKLVKEGDAASVLGKMAGGAR